MAADTPTYQHMILHQNATGMILFPWSQQWLKDRSGRGALEKQINRLQKYGWEVVSMAGGSFGILFLAVPTVTVLFRRSSDYHWNENSLEEVKALFTAGQKIAAVMLYRDITGMELAESRKAVEAMQVEL